MKSEASKEDMSNEIASIEGVMYAMKDASDDAGSSLSSSTWGAFMSQSGVGSASASGSTVTGSGSGSGSNSGSGSDMGYGTGAGAGSGTSSSLTGSTSYFSGSSNNSREKVSALL